MLSLLTSLGSLITVVRMEEVFHGEVEIVDGKVDSINIHEKTIEIKILAGYVQLKTMDRLAEDVHCEINAMHGHIVAVVVKMVAACGQREDSKGQAEVAVGQMEAVNCQMVAGA
ncbi:hypothetical protein N7533_011295 [Penicillium manginii]|uniref:uncharacterized protein n=1 Tax=Penicillium manginii TaxID=203109 RepID=UPI002547BAE1|nr:uncharacterized protein N7533_011295 [Penicillium manginii]KAJ5741886.1 hypothetical protein N7533_011295 [Penicillium manginii]